MVRQEETIVLQLLNCQIYVPQMRILLSYVNKIKYSSMFPFHRIPSVSVRACVHSCVRACVRVRISLSYRFIIMKIIVTKVNI